MMVLLLFWPLCSSKLSSFTIWLTEYSAFVRQEMLSLYDYPQPLVSWNLKASMANYAGIDIWKAVLEMHSSTKPPLNHSTRTRPVWVPAKGARSFLKVSGCTERRRKQQWRLRGQHHLAARVQPKLPQIAPMALLNLPSHLVKFSLVQKAKGNSLSEIWKMLFHRINHPRSSSAIGVQWVHGSRKPQTQQVFALCSKSLAMQSHKCHSITQSRTGFLAQINSNFCFKRSETKISC